MSIKRKAEKKIKRKAQSRLTRYSNLSTSTERRFIRVVAESCCYKSPNGYNNGQGKKDIFSESSVL